MKLDGHPGKTVERQGTHLELEVLEERIAPAGGVTAFVSHGTLVITGDALGNDIVIDDAGLAATELRISSGLDATTVNGGAEDVLQGVTGGIVLKMADGDDHARFDGVDVATSITFDGQLGANHFELTGDSIVHGSVIARNANVAGIAGATVAGDVRILNTTGFSTVTISSLDARSLSIRNGDGGDIATLNGLTLTGRLSIQTGYGYGDTTTQINDSRVSSVGFASGWGLDSFTATGLTCTSGGVAFRLSDGPDSSSVSISGSTINGSMVIIGDMVDLDDTVVMKAVTARGIRGFYVTGCTLGIDAASGRNYGVNVAASTGHLTQLVDVEIGGSFRLAAYAGGLFTWGWPVSVDMDGVSIGGNLNIRSGTWTWGDAHVAINGTQVSGAAVINTTYGQDHITIDDSTFSRSVIINTRGGSDLVEIEANGAPDGPASTFSGAVTVLAGDGDDTVTLGAAGQPGNHGVYAGRVLPNGQADYDILTMVDGANTFASRPVPAGFETINT